MMLTHYLILVLFLSGSFAQYDPHFSNQHNVIVQLFEWTWKDIAEECERFLQHHGYGGVQISPPNENLILTNRPWYERYQPVSYALKTRSGNEENFKNMTRRCNNVGVRIYADTVINHMSASDGVGTGGNSANNGYYPSVPYGPGDFHDTCAINNYNDLNNVRNCQLVGLRDLNHQKKHVSDKIVEYMNHLIDLGVAGFRVDAAKHMWPADLKQIMLRIKDLNTEFGFKPHSRPFIYLEVIDTGTEPTKASDYKHIATVMEFKFSKKISNMFNGNDKLTYLSNWGTSWGFLDSNFAVVFVDNHDLQREDNHLHYKDSKRYKMANAFMLAHPYGIAKVMSSFHFNSHGQGPPMDSNENLLSPKINPDNTCGNGYVCEHRWRQIYNMVKFRNIVGDAPLTNWWSNGDQQISFCRGNKGFVAFTQWLDLKAKLQTCLPPGQYCDIISGDLKNNKCTGKTITVKKDGKASISILSSDEDGVIALLENVKVV